MPRRSPGPELRERSNVVGARHVGGAARRAAAAHPRTPDDPREAAESAGLRYFSDDRPGITRRKAGARFFYLGQDGRRVSDPGVLARIRSLAVPPAWTDVWICPFADGHVQATGRDARGRKQYRYHPRFREVRDSTKYERMAGFAESLPALRARIGEHMRSPGLSREKVLATVVHLLEATLIRVGNNDYARHNNSYGLTTLKTRHVAVDGADIRFRFLGKGGRQWALTVKSRRVARIIKACQELPGQQLLQYLDENGDCQDVTSSDVNAYLREVTGLEITAKDFRTWAGTVLAALTLCELEVPTTKAQARRDVRTAIEQVAARLGNTPTICRKCYVHPGVLEAYLEGELRIELKAQGAVPTQNGSSGLEPEEAAVLAMLRARSERAAVAPSPRAATGRVRQQHCVPPGTLARQGA
jgi:DNA topoisomerase-1